MTAHEIANIYQNASDEIGAGALATLAELELLKCVYQPTEKTDASVKPEAATKKKAAKANTHPEVVALCNRLINRLGAEAFMVAATQRQFQRYTKAGMRPEWQEIAEAALAVFNKALGTQQDQH